MTYAVVVQAILVWRGADLFTAREVARLYAGARVLPVVEQRYLAIVA